MEVIAETSRSYGIFMFERKIIRVQAVHGSQKIPLSNILFDTASALIVTEYMEKLKSMHKLGALNVKYARKNTHSLFHVAIVHESVNALDYLCKTFPDDINNVLHPSSKSPLLLAAERGSCESVAVLIENGCEVIFPSRFPCLQLPMHAIQTFDMVTTLARYGGPRILDVCAGCGWTPLDRTTRDQNYEAARALSILSGTQCELRPFTYDRIAISISSEDDVATLRKYSFFTMSLVQKLFIELEQAKHRKSSRKSNQTSISRVPS